MRPKCATAAATAPLHSSSLDTIRRDRQQALARHIQRLEQANQRFRVGVQCGDAVPGVEQGPRHDAAEAAGRAGQQDCALFELAAHDVTPSTQRKRPYADMDTANTVMYLT